MSDFFFFKTMLGTVLAQMVFTESFSTVHHSPENSKK